MVPVQRQLQQRKSVSMLWAIRRTLKFLWRHMDEDVPEFKSSGRTKRMHLTRTSRQPVAVWAGMVIVFSPRCCSLPLVSISVNITARAVRLPGQIFFKVRSNWTMRPWDSRYTSPRSSLRESWQPSMEKSIGTGQGSGWTIMPHWTKTSGSGNVTALFSSKYPERRRGPV